MTDKHRHDDLDERLVDLDRRIRLLEAELAAREVGPPGPRYYETGTIHPELHDEAITP